jgi:hypothetical protein
MADVDERASTDRERAPKGVHEWSSGEGRSALDQRKANETDTKILGYGGRGARLLKGDLPVDIRNGLRNAMPRTYRRVSFGYNAVRLFGSMRGPSVNFDMLRDVINKAKGTSEKECPICGFTGLFRAFGSPPRWDALCPSCGSLERHRLFALVLNSTPPILTNGAAVLHFAPEKCTKMDLLRLTLDKPPISGG